MKSLVLALVLSFLPASVFAGGFDAGNGGLGIACLKVVTDPRPPYQHKNIFTQGRFYDLVLWGPGGPAPTPLEFARPPKLEDGIELAMRRLVAIDGRLRAPLVKELENVRGFIKKAEDDYRNGWSFGHISKTPDYPNVFNPKYRCGGRATSEIFQLVQYSHRGEMIMLIELYLALPVLDQAALHVHETVYRMFTVLGREPDDAGPITQLTALLLAREFDQPETARVLRELTQAPFRPVRRPMVPRRPVRR